MVAISHLSVALVGLAGLATAAPIQSDGSLTKRIACSSGNCNFPSTFGKHKMAGVVARDEDALYERDDDIEEYLTKRIACPSGNCKFPSTFGKHKMAGAVARDEDALYERDDDLYEREDDLYERDDDLYERDDDIEEYLTKRIACPSGNCKFPSTFGKHKMAGAVARDEDALYERGDIEAILEARGTGSRLLKTLKNHFLPFRRDLD